MNMVSVKIDGFRKTTKEDIICLVEENADICMLSFEEFEVPKHELLNLKIKISNKIDEHIESEEEIKEEYGEIEEINDEEIQRKMYKHMTKSIELNWLKERIAIEEQLS